MKWPFHQALYSWGLSNFEWTVVFADVSDGDLDALEIDAIRVYQTVVPHGYNLEAGGASAKTHPLSIEKFEKSTTGRKNGPMSESHKRKIGAANKGKLTGRKLPPEVIAKMAAALTGIKRGSPSSDHLIVMRRVMKEKWADPEFQNKMKQRPRYPSFKKRVFTNTEYLKSEYLRGVSTTALAKEMGCDRGVITRHLVEAGVQIRPAGRWAFLKSVKQGGRPCLSVE